MVDLLSACALTFYSFGGRDEVLAGGHFSALHISKTRAELGVPTSRGKLGDKNSSEKLGDRRDVSLYNCRTQATIGLEWATVR